MSKKAKIRTKKSKHSIPVCIISALAVIVFLFFTPLMHNIEFQAQNGMATIFSTQNPEFITRFSYISVMKNLIVILGDFGNLSVLVGVLLGAYLFVPVIVMVMYLVAILYAVTYATNDDGEDKFIKRKTRTTKKLFKTASVVALIIFTIDILIVFAFDFFMFKSIASIPGITVILGWILAILCIKYSNKI